MASVTLALGASAIPAKHIRTVGRKESFCEIPIGDCFTWEDGDGLDCEWCCVNLTPPVGSLCHTDADQAGSCGDGGSIWHCAAHF